MQSNILILEKQAANPGERLPCLIDTTLREGNQAPGVRFGIPQSMEIASALVELGVDAVECGHPASSEFERQRVTAVVNACGSLPVLAHARARVGDIESVHETGAKWVGVFLGINSLSNSTRVRSTEPIHSMIEKAVNRAQLLDLKIRFTIEDGTRTSWPNLRDAFRAALDNGAERICLADTVGLLCPWEIDTIVRRIVESFPGVELEVHLHDDRGLAGANALTSIRAGARWVSSSVNGIGERCGITDTITLLANLGALGLRIAPSGGLLQKVSRLVQAHSRLPLDRWRPVAGANATTHVARLHQRSVQANPLAYAWIDPGFLGKKNTITPNILPKNYENLINRPKAINVKEQPVPAGYHAGDYFLMLDDNAVQDARQTCIVIDLPVRRDNAVFIDSCRRVCDSLFVFIGRDHELTGMTVEVKLGEHAVLIDSPGSVFIPAGVLHSGSIIAGEGLFINHILSETHEASLLDEIKFRDPIMEILQSFVQERIPGVSFSFDTPLLEVFDSLLFLDLFLYLEGIFEEMIPLDAVSVCKTFNDLAILLNSIGTSPKEHQSPNKIQSTKSLCVE